MNLKIIVLALALVAVVSLGCGQAEDLMTRVAPDSESPDSGSQSGDSNDSQSAPSTQIVPVTQVVQVTQVVPVTEVIQVTQEVPVTQVVQVTQVVPVTQIISVTAPPPTLPPAVWADSFTGDAVSDVRWTTATGGFGTTIYQANGRLEIRHGINARGRTFSGEAVSACKIGGISTRRSATS